MSHTDTDLNLRILRYREGGPWCKAVNKEDRATNALGWRLVFYYCFLVVVVFFGLV